MARKPPPKKSLLQSLRDWWEADGDGPAKGKPKAKPKAGSKGKEPPQPKKGEPKKGQPKKTTATLVEATSERVEAVRAAVGPRLYRVRKQVNADVEAVRKAAKDPRKTAENVWKNHRLELFGGAALFVGIFAIVGYMAFKRPGDVLNPDVPFVGGQTQTIKQTVDWPTYGYDDKRTRYLPAGDLEAPFSKIWDYDAGDLLEYSPIVAEGVVYGIDKNANVFAIDAKFGNVLWKEDVGELNASAPTYDDGKLFIVNLEPGQALALDADTGKTLWKHELPDRSESSPTVRDGKVIFGCQNGELFALDEDDGKEEWSTDLGGEVKAAPAEDDGIVYVGTYSGEMFAVHADSGDIKWRSSGQGSSFGRAGRFYGSPAIAFGRVYAGNVDGRMYSFDKQNGDLAWSHSTGGYVYAAPVVADTPKSPPTVYFGSFDSTFYALDAEDGSERWTADLKGAVSGAGSLVDETVYVANIGSTETQGFNADSGKQVFQINSGAYNPVISDGKRVYITGFDHLAGFQPQTEERTRAEKERARRREAKKG